MRDWLKVIGRTRSAILVIWMVLYAALLISLKNTQHFGWGFSYLATFLKLWPYVPVYFFADFAFFVNSYFKIEKKTFFLKRVLIYYFVLLITWSSVYIPALLMQK